MNSNYKYKDIYSVKVRLKDITKKKGLLLRDLITTYSNAVNNVSELCRDDNLRPNQYRPASSHLLSQFDENLKRSIVKEAKRRLNSRNIRQYEKNETKFDFINRYNDIIKHNKNIYQSIQLNSKNFNRFENGTNFYFWYKIKFKIGDNYKEINIPIKLNKNILRFENNKKMDLLNLIRLDLDKKGDIYITFLYSKHKFMARFNNRPVFIRGEVKRTNKSASLFHSSMLTMDKHKFNDFTNKLMRYVKYEKVSFVNFSIDKDHIREITKKVKYLYYVLKNQDKYYSYSTKKLYQAAFVKYLQIHTKLIKNLQLLLRRFRSYGVSYDVEALQMTNIVSIMNKKCYGSHLYELSSPIVDEFKSINLLVRK